MTLNRNPTDYHTEIEQAAFDVSNLVPGIGPSPDKMLLGRIFSVWDILAYGAGILLAVGLDRLDGLMPAKEMPHSPS